METLFSLVINTVKPKLDNGIYSDHTMEVDPKPVEGGEVAGSITQLGSLLTLEVSCNYANAKVRFKDAYCIGTSINNLCIYFY